VNYYKLGQRIKDARKKSFIMQEQLAEAVELSAVYIGQIERGERKLSIDTLVKIANTLNTSIESLLKDSIRNNTDAMTNELLPLLFLPRINVPELLKLRDRLHVC